MPIEERMPDLPLSRFRAVFDLRPMTARSRCHDARSSCCRAGCCRLTASAGPEDPSRTPHQTWSTFPHRSGPCPCARRDRARPIYCRRARTRRLTRAACHLHPIVGGNRDPNVEPRRSQCRTRSAKIFKEGPSYCHEARRLCSDMTSSNSKGFGPASTGRR